jgi:putative nucleotidyltransferase with HDIG domain
MQSHLDQQEADSSVLAAIPPLPAVAAELLKLLADEDAEVNKVVELLRTDPRFSTEILRLANSSLYCRGAGIDSLERAVMRLGFEKVKSIALTVATGHYAQTAMKIPELRRCWEHCLACAVLSEDLAKALRMSSDRAYMGGLLHDMGRLGLIVAYPGKYTEFLKMAEKAGRDELSAQFLETERHVFGLDHCQVGGLLMEEWGLPDELGMIASGHHEDWHDSKKPSIASVVCMCDRMAESVGFSTVHSDAVREFSEARADLHEAVPAEFWQSPEEITGRAEHCLSAMRS